ncbi:TPM domain-containing protein [Candidatus Microgenomates bacterium]|nr:TPM domain-containing protein [Candidatus Microgenomates bacterium]
MISSAKKIGLVFCGAFLVFSFAHKAQALDLPEYMGFVNDYAKILKDETKINLENQITELEKETHHEIAIAIVPNLQETTIEDYAEKLFQKWAIGKKELDNGVLLLIAINDRKLRIETGYGLEGILPDITAGRIVNDIITPEFKNGDYDSGVVKGVETIAQTIKGEVVDYPDKINFDGRWFEYIFFGIIFLFSILGQSKRWWPGGVWMGGGALVYALIAGMAIIGAVVLVFSMTLFGLILDYIFSKMPQNKGRGGSNFWYWGGGGGSSGGGFGGFGGGSSGGGGASGSW